MQFYTLSQQSLVKIGGSIVVEEYIPLWMASGTKAISSNTSAGTAFLDDGTTSNSSTSASKLHTLNSNWSSSQIFSFEATMENGGGSVAYASLWDFTSNTQISGSQIYTSANTYTVVRSGQFTLTPGHTYGITWWTGNSSYGASITDASLIVFG